MRLTLAAIGRMKAGPEKLLADDYAARISEIGRKVGVAGLAVRDFAESQKPDAAQRMAEEERWLWSAVPDGAHVVALDERGKAHGSMAFSGNLRRLMDQGQQNITFLLGGPDGHSAHTRGRASELLALGPMTLPHRLARIVLLEQLYRAFTIILGHPYHRA